MATISDILNEFGLGSGEARLYTVLLQHGFMTAGQLASRLGLPRSTIYGLLDNLKKHYLIRQNFGEPVSQFRAEPPEKLRQLLNAKITHLSQQQADLDQIIPHLKRISTDLLFDPTIEVGKGRPILKKCLEDCLFYKDITISQFLWPKAFTQLLGKDYLTEWNRKRIKHSIVINEIWPVESTIEFKKNPFYGVGREFNRAIRLAPPSFKPTTSYWVYENRTVFALLNEETITIAIESSALADLTKDNFELLWNVSKPTLYETEWGQPFLQKILRGG